MPVSRTRKRKLLIAAVVILAILAAWWPHERPMFVTNDTPSMARGLYMVHDLEGEPRPGQVVVVRIPAGWRDAIQRGGLITDASRYLLKRIVAGPGQTVEVMGGRYAVDGRPVADIEPEGVARFGVSAGERLAPGCYAVATGYRRGVDSRYFGPVSLADIVGRATLIIPYEGGQQ